VGATNSMAVFSAIGTRSSSRAGSVSVYCCFAVVLSKNDWVN